MGFETTSKCSSADLGSAMPKIFGIRWGLRSADPQGGAERRTGEEIENAGRRSRQDQSKDTEENGQAKSTADAVDLTKDKVTVPVVSDRDALLDLLGPEVDGTVERLSAKRFKPDPLAGRHFSRMVSLFSSAYKRHGYILESAILQRLAQNPDFEVWSDPKFSVSKVADELVATLIPDPSEAIGREVPYGDEARTLQVDIIVWDKKQKTVTAYEIKRGHGDHDSGKKRSIQRDLLCVQVLLKNYAIARGLTPKTASSRIIFYYGRCSIPKPFSLTKDELDEHFGMSVHAEVEAVNMHFRRRLFEILSD